MPNFCLKIFFLSLILTILKAEHYEIRLNSDISVSYTYNRSVIETYNKKSQYQCLAECNKMVDCLVIVYDRTRNINEINCFLYARYFDNGLIVQSNSVDMYIKNNGNVTPRLIEIFKNYENSSLKEQLVVAIDGLRNFDTYVHNNRAYYCIPRSYSILIYDEDWNYITTYARPAPIFYIKIVDNKDIYSSTTSKIQKTDTALNLLNESISAVSGYRELFYYKKTDQIYGTNLGSSKIDIFDRDLNFLDAINTGRGNHAIFVFNDILYIGANNGFLMAYQYKTILYDIKVAYCGGFIFSIIIDNYGQLSVVCDNRGFLLYDINGTYLNYNISLSRARFLNFGNELQGIVMDDKNLNIIKNLF